MGQLLAGAIIIENVFTLPGLGRLVFQAIGQRDLPVVREWCCSWPPPWSSSTFSWISPTPRVDPRIRLNGRITAMGAFSKPEFLLGNGPVHRRGLSWPLVSLFWTPYAPTAWTPATGWRPLPCASAGHGPVRPGHAFPGNGRSGELHHRRVDDRGHRHGCGRFPGIGRRLGPPAGRRSHHALFGPALRLSGRAVGHPDHRGLGPSVVNAMLAIGIFYIPVFARLTRASALTVKGLDYIAAARAAGRGRRPSPGAMCCPTFSRR
jgi:hypothetical protein